MSRAPAALIVMGVSGSGKTTVGRLLAGRLAWAFEEGDDLHPAANIEKMKSGRPLDDEDRRPWLEAIGRWIDASAEADRAAVVTCSALKRAYRDLLAQKRPQVLFVFIDLDRATLAERVAGRKGHFMPASLLDSQLADLEPPGADEPAIRIDGHPPAAEQADFVLKALETRWP